MCPLLVCHTVSILGRPFVQRFALCFQTVVLSVCVSLCPVLSICNIDVLWPNSWMDQGAT